MISVARETKIAPRNLQARIAKVGGSNVFGEPNFRIVWGWSRLAWMGGKWQDAHREVVEYRLEPKYMPFDRWHIEKWMPPASYGSPRDWKERTTAVIGGRLIEQLGPYPSRGEYEHCFTIQKPGGAYADPFYSEMAEFIVRAVIASRRLIEEDALKIKNALREDAESKDRAWSNEADAILSDTMPAFGLRPRVAVTRSLEE